MLLLAAVLLASPAQYPQATCLRAYGETACGYHCTQGYGQVRCAQTPVGNCQAGYGTVVCYDPPVPVLAWSQTPVAQCLAEYGLVACGYGCVAQYGSVRCSPVPGGVCAAQAGRITCSGEGLQNVGGHHQRHHAPRRR